VQYTSLIIMIIQQDEDVLINRKLVMT
jgi:hypothetical protein